MASKVISSKKPTVYQPQSRTHGINIYFEDLKSFAKWYEALLGVPYSQRGSRDKVARTCLNGMPQVEAQLDKLGYDLGFDFDNEKLVIEAKKAPSKESK